MDDQSRQQQGDQRVEPVRSRWTPKPEQILILETIFNSGLVNPPKEETIRIRKLLEKFGSVGDANVFYWFQNRRSRSRRRQRQIQATLSGAEPAASASLSYPMNTSPTPSSSCSAGGLLSLSGPGPVQQLEQNPPVFCSPANPTSFPYQSGN